jgi:ubiquinone/menaquinone biosynthesis C-methylase UbiE
MTRKEGHGPTPVDARAALKRRVRAFWDSSPNQLKIGRSPAGTEPFFREIDTHRYTWEWHLRETVRFRDYAGQRVMELGCGLGSDGASFAAAGARYVGVDLSLVSLGIAARRPALRGRLVCGDGERLPFRDGAFDAVYSYGVIHHTPQTESVVDEFFRVLVAGGRAVVMIYHKTSYWWLRCRLWSLVFYVLRFDAGVWAVHAITGRSVEALRVHQESLRRDPEFLRSTFLNRVTDEWDTPVSKAYTGAEARQMFRRFVDVELRARYLAQVRALGRLTGPRAARAVERAVGALFGWHLFIFARKPVGSHAAVVTHDRAAAAGMS